MELPARQKKPKKIRREGGGAVTWTTSAATARFAARSEHLLFKLGFWHPLGICVCDCSETNSQDVYRHVVCWGSPWCIAASQADILE